jgi:hypothetical protein
LHAVGVKKINKNLAVPAMLQGPSSKPVLQKVVLNDWALMKFGEMLIKEIEETEWTIK